MMVPSHLKNASVIFFAILVYFLPADLRAAEGVAPADGVRQRISINADWRFQKDDPPGVGGTLAYGKIKHWYLPSGAAFSKDPALQLKRPEGTSAATFPMCSLHSMTRAGGS